jgi:hypothetical protein
MGKAVLLVALIALVIYALLRLWEKRSAARLPRRPQHPQAPRPRRVIAPDDDADFLRDLERKRRRGKRGEQPKGQQSDPDA